FDPGAYSQSGGFRGDPFGFGGTGAGGRDFHFSWGKGEEQPGFAAEDIFAEILGGRRRANSRQSPGEDFKVVVPVSFDEYSLGGTRRVALKNGEQIDVKLPQGLREGQQIRVKGRGGAGRGGGPSGDVLIQVQVAPHPFMSRDGDDLKMDLPITLKEAVGGGK